VPGASSAEFITPSARPPVANFIPLKRHLLRCLREAIRHHSLKGPFLDVGCGQGDVSLWLAKRGWSGKAIDFSESAIDQAAKRLTGHPKITVACQALDAECGTFETVLAWDVLEHVAEEQAALNALSQRTQAGGHLVLSVPSHPLEWRWDDDFYGHVRRYTPEDLTQKLEAAGFEILTIWDSTFPIFWAMRRAYTWVKNPPSELGSPVDQTKASSGISAWHLPVIGLLLNHSWVLWEPLSWLQFALFRKMIQHGHELFVVARKRKEWGAGF
jgi:SAM-dependent methyltransferase